MSAAEAVAVAALAAGFASMAFMVLDARRRVIGWGFLMSCVVSMALLAVAASDPELSGGWQ